LEGVSGFPLGYHIGSARTEVVRFFRCGGLAPLLAPARPRHVRVRMVSRFSAQAAKGRVQKYPSWEPVPVALSPQAPLVFPQEDYTCKTHK
jgi:hypothetical protein